MDTTIELSILPAVNQLKARKLAGVYRIFVAGGDLYGIKESQVFGTAMVRKLLTVPDMPGSVCGIVQLPDGIVPAIDPCGALCRNNFEKPQDIHLIVVGTAGKNRYVRTGILADQIRGLRKISVSHVLRKSFLGLSKETRYIRAVAKTGADTVFLLDVEKLLREPEFGGNGDQKG